MSSLQPLDQEREYSILFIGNSYTFFHDMPSAIFQPMVQAAGYRIKVTAVTKGGYTLKKFSNPLDAEGARVTQALEGAGKGAYDFVILQEQSVLPAGERQNEFFEGVRALSSRIRAMGAQPILYQTWGRKSGNEILDQYGWTNEEMTLRLAQAYGQIGAELGIPVAKVGDAFFDVYTTQPQIELYHPDCSHPSYAGSFLTASVLLATVFGVDLTAVDFIGALSQKDAGALRQAARMSVLN